MVYNPLRGAGTALAPDFQIFSPAAWTTAWRDSSHKSTASGFSKPRIVPLSRGKENRKKYRGALIVPLEGMGRRVHHPA
jgi:hypothetical protein